MRFRPFLHARLVGVSLIMIGLLGTGLTTAIAPASIRLKANDISAELVKLRAQLEADPSASSDALEAYTLQRSALEKRLDVNRSLAMAQAIQSGGSLGAWLVGLLGSLTIGRTAGQHALIVQGAIAGSRHTLLRERYVLAILISLLASVVVVAASAGFSGAILGSGFVSWPEAGILIGLALNLAFWATLGFTAAAVSQNLVVPALVLSAALLAASAWQSRWSIWVLGARALAGDEVTSWPPAGFYPSAPSLLWLPSHSESLLTLSAYGLVLLASAFLSWRIVDVGL